MAGGLVTAQGGIRFGCQTYSWQMSGERFRGCVAHIAAMAAEAGFAGLEPEMFMLGPELRTNELLSRVLADFDLQLAALAYAADWRNDRETGAERSGADDAIALLRAFPGARLVLVQLPGADRRDLVRRQRRAIGCMNAVARRALAAGVQPTVHPNSPPGSVFRTAHDYEILIEGLDPDVGFTPDAGHIAAGGMDVLEVVRRYRDRIDHVHFKDIHSDGTWAPIGEGRLDFVGIVSFLMETAYEGWVVLEDESENAQREPDESARRNGSYVRDTLLPVLDSAAGHPRICSVD